MSESDFVTGHIAQISEYASPICLPERSEVGEAFVGETMTVSGWGRESDSSSSIARVHFFNWYK
jgi:hypothetical protein